MITRSLLDDCGRGCEVAGRMTSYRELVQTFDAEGVATWPMEQLWGIGLASGNARVLADVGLPSEVPVIFTTEVQGEPDQFSECEFSLGGTPTKILILGGPPGDPATRYFLDAYDSVVGLFTFSEEAPRVEVDNTSMHDFVSFLHLCRVYVRKMEGVKPVERLKLIRELSTRFREQDEFAFDKYDGGWSGVLDHLQGDLRI